MSSAASFIFIGGSEGSGTTFLLRLLSAPFGCVSLGGNHQKLPDHPDAKPLVEAFLGANAHVWNRRNSFEEHEQGQREWREAFDRIVTEPAFAATSAYFFKRSFPFSKPHGQFTPDLWDLVDLWPEAKIVVIYRDPCASTYSALRRGFDTDLRRLAVVCSEQLTRLASQVAAIGAERVRIVSYSQLSSAPALALEPICRFCGVSFDEVCEAIARERESGKSASRWDRELDQRDVDWLNRFFDQRRRKQWQVLEARALR